MSKQKKKFPVQLKEGTGRKMTFEVHDGEDINIYYSLIAGCAQGLEIGAKCCIEGDLIMIEFQNGTNAERMRKIWDQ